MSDGRLLRLCEAADFAGLSVRTLRRALHDRQRRLHYYRFGRAVRIAPADLATWMHAHRALPALAAPVLDQLSPTARQLLRGILGSEAPTALHSAGSTVSNPAETAAKTVT